MRVPCAILLTLLLPSSAGAEPIQTAAVITIGMSPTSKKARRLRDRVRMALKERADVALIPEAEETRLFASAAPKRQTKRLEGSSKHLRRASRALRNFELDKAQAGYAKATSLLEPLVGSRQAAKVDRERLEIGVSLAHALRNDDQLQELMLEYAIRYGGEAPPSWPPELTERLKGAAPAENTEMDVLSTPPGAEIFVDGVRRGVTPAQLPARPGPHRVELFLPDHHPADVWVATTTLKKQKVDLSLAPDVSMLLESQSAAAPIDPGARDRIVGLAAGAGASLVIVAAFDSAGIQLRKLSASGEENTRPVGENSPAGAKLVVTQLFETGPVIGPIDVPIWAWVGVGVGAAAVVTGLGLRYSAIGAQDDLIARQGSLTQQDAFDRNSTVNARATSGAVVLGVGSLAIAGIAAWLVYDLLSSD